MTDNSLNFCRAIVAPFPSLFDRALLSVLNAIKPNNNNNRWSMAFSLKTIKGLASDASVALSRAVQYTEEKLGYTERTELDAEFESLVDRTDKSKKWTEKIVANTEAVLQPNPNTRVEDYLFEKLEKRREKERMRNLEWLGADMIDAGVDFGSESVYGSALIKVGQSEQKLGETEREFVTSAYKNFVRPLKMFLDGDMRAVTKERRSLEAKRLDLDAAKARLRKAKTAETQANLPDAIDKELEQAEREVHTCQEDFDIQVGNTKLLMESMNAAQGNHVRCLSDFVEAQIAYYATCHQHMCDLQKELACLKANNATANNGNLANGPTSKNLTITTNQQSSKPTTVKAMDLTSPTDQMPASLPAGKRRARVLYDYAARNATELTLEADEIIIVQHSKELDADWLMGERGSEKGKVPLPYLELC